jgi:8-oxo-dGTP diphosphatase
MTTRERNLLSRYDPAIQGTKGLVFIGDEVLIYRRDTNTTLAPLLLDVPGGGQEPGETPYETFARELWEEFGLELSPDDIIYVRKYSSTMEPGARGCFVAAQLPASAWDEIEFGDEGLEYMTMPLMDYLASSDSWPVIDEQIISYLAAASVLAFS